MIAAAILFLVTQNQTVTFTHPCAHSSVVLEAFGREIGETIKPSGSVNKDYFLVRFDRMPVEDAKAAIAKTLNATWTKQGEVLYLNRTRAQELAEERHLEQKLLERLDGIWQMARERRNNDTPYTLQRLVQAFEGKERPEFDDRSLSPANRMGDRILLTMTPSEVLRMAEGMVTFSTVPGVDELPIPEAWSRIVSLFIDESDVWNLALDTVTGSGSIVRGGPAASQAISVTITKSAYSLQFRVATKSGDSTSRQGLMLASFQSEILRPSDDFLEGLDEPYEAPEELIKAARIFGPGYRRTGEQEPVNPFERTPLLDEMVRDIEGHEPLTVFASWPYLAVTERKGVNLVAVLPDSASSRVFEILLSPGMSLREAIRRLSWWFDISFDEESNYWSLRPADPKSARESRADRSAVGDFLRTADSRGWIGLDDYAQFLINSGQPYLTSPWMQWHTIAVRVRNHVGHWRLNEIFAVRLYSLLAPAMRRSARSGWVELPVSRWPRPVFDAISQYAWNDERFFTDEDADEIGSFGRFGEFTGLATATTAGDGRTVAAVLREGLPRGALLRVRVTSRFELYAQTKDGRSTILPWHRVGKELNFIERREANGQEHVYVTDKFGYMPIEVLDVHLVVPGVGATALRARFGRVPRLSEVGAIDKLPAEAQTAIRREMERARDGGLQRSP